MKELTISVYNTIGQAFGIEASDGELVFNQIKTAFSKDVKVLLDFKNIELLTSAFLNTAIGQLYGSNKEDFIEAHLDVKNMLDEDQILLKKVIEAARSYYSGDNNLQKSIDEILGEY